MDRTVVALYDDVNNAQRAVEELLSGGFDRNDISVVRTNQPTGTTADAMADQTATQGSATATGAGIGAVLGGITGLVVGLGALAIPGIGPIVAAGPLAAALAGAGIGAATGGVIGALTDAGIPKEEAEFYAEGIRRGGTLVTVRTSETEHTSAMQILSRFSPVDIQRRATEWSSLDWTGSRPDADSYTNVYAREFEDVENEFRRDFETRYQSKGYGYERYRPAYQYGWEAHKLFGGRDWEAIEPELQDDWLRLHPSDVWSDFRDAVRTGWERFREGARDVGQRVERDFDRTTTDMSRTSDAYDGDFRSNYEQIYRTSGYGYGRYRPAYQYGYALATEERYRGRPWDEIELDARRDWEMQHPSNAWEDFRDAVRHAWQRVRADVRDTAD